MLLLRRQKRLCPCRQAASPKNPTRSVLHALPTGSDEWAQQLQGSIITLPFQHNACESSQECDSRKALGLSQWT